MLRWCACSIPSTSQADPAPTPAFLTARPSPSLAGPCAPGTVKRLRWCARALRRPRAGPQACARGRARAVRAHGHALPLPRCGQARSARCGRAWQRAAQCGMQDTLERLRAPAALRAPAPGGASKCSRAAPVAACARAARSPARPSTPPAGAAAGGHRGAASLRRARAAALWPCLRAPRPLQRRRCRTPPSSHVRRRRHCRVTGADRLSRRLLRGACAGRPQRPSRPPRRQHRAPTGGARSARARAFTGLAQLSSGTGARCMQAQWGHPRATKIVDVRHPARTPARWGPSAVCEKRGCGGVKREGLLKGLNRGIPLLFASRRLPQGTHTWFCA